MAVAPDAPASVAGELLERDDQLALLERAFAQAQGGQGRLVFLSGEAGIGKSALVRGFCARVHESTPVLLGACDGLRTPRPLGPFADIGLRVGGELGAAISGGAPAPAVFEALVGALPSGRTTVLVIEDVHWADEATLDVLRLVGPRVEGLRALVVATYRSDELPRTHPLLLVLGDATTERSYGTDLVLDRPSRFGLGFQLTQAERPLGPNPGAFGHYGAGGALGFCDPDAGLAFGYVMNRMAPGWQSPRNRALIDAVYEALTS